jgi:hypothetical protein
MTRERVLRYSREIDHDESKPAAPLQLCGAVTTVKLIASLQLCCLRNWGHRISTLLRNLVTTLSNDRKNPVALELESIGDYRAQQNRLLPSISSALVFRSR